MKNRNAELEKAFKRRYNRIVEVGRTIERKGHIIVATIAIRSGNTEYVLKDYIENGLTKYVTVEYGDKMYKFKSYLEAEVFVADKIGEAYGDN